MWLVKSATRWNFHSMPFWQGCIITFFSSFNGIFSTIASLSTSIQLEQAQSMKCSVSKSFKISTSSDLQNEVMPTLNETFELTSDDIRSVSDEN